MPACSTACSALQDSSSIRDVIHSKRLYEDTVLGRVTDEQYRMLSGDYTDEQRMLEEQIPQKEQRLAQLQAREANVDAFIDHDDTTGFID